MFVILMPHQSEQRADRCVQLRGAVAHDWQAVAWAIFRNHGDDDTASRLGRDTATGGRHGGVAEAQTGEIGGSD